MQPAVTIGTRGSALALCQARLVQARLEACAPELRLRLQPIASRADEHPERPLEALGGEGVFVKELEAALLERRADLAVHSMKDLPLALPETLCIAAVLAREDARDALVSRRGQELSQLPDGARVGTSSPRRRSQLLRERPGLQVVEMRGNVETRLRKLDDGEYDAVVLAACGLARLGLQGRITEYLPLTRMVPEPGQGALAVEARRDDAALLTRLRALDDAPTRACIDAERAFLAALGGGCRVPIAAHAAREQDQLALQGLVITLDGRRQVHGTIRGSMRDAPAVGNTLADRLIARGARELLRE